MGIQISEIIPRKEIELAELARKTIAIDAMNSLYQFLTTIRQQDGTPLMDSDGNVSSHLSGIFYRNIALLEAGITPIYVFDGSPSDLKKKELERRLEKKTEARENYEAAKEEGDIVGMRKYSQQTVRVSSEIINESKELLGAMGISFIDSLNEGEAEAAFLAKKGVVWASASQDFDSLLYGTPRLIRNMTLSRKRRSSSGVILETKIEFIELTRVLEVLQIDVDQLICLGILVGTDFNPGGVRGIGQKKALEIVRANKYPVKIFEFLENSKRYDLNFDWTEIFRVFKNYGGNYRGEDLEKNADLDKIKEILLARGFSEDRIIGGIERLKNIQVQKRQKGLSDFF